jgi:hypothetical protein
VFAQRVLNTFKNVIEDVPTVSVAIVVVPKVDVPVTFNVPFVEIFPPFVTVAFPLTDKYETEVVAAVVVANVAVLVAVKFPTVKLRNDAKDESKPLTDRSPQIVEVPVVEELPAINVPSSRTCNVDEPAAFVTFNPAVVDEIPEPCTFAIVAVAIVVVPVTDNELVAVIFADAKFVDVAFVIVAFTALSPRNVAMFAHKFWMFAQVIEEEATVSVAIDEVPATERFPYIQVPVSVTFTASVPDAIILTIWSAVDVPTSTRVIPVRSVICVGSTIWIVPPIPVVV